jgi:hypothetical protein
MLVAQHMFFAERIVELINIYGISFMHDFIIYRFDLTCKW